jgi:hypothetical protein
MQNLSSNTCYLISSLFMFITSLFMFGNYGKLNPPTLSVSFILAVGWYCLLSVLSVVKD